jgi:hypothetical protein
MSGQVVSGSLAKCFTRMNRRHCLRLFRHGFNLVLALAIATLPDLAAGCPDDNLKFGGAEYLVCRFGI